MRALLLVLALCLPVGADILIGDKPCLWKRAITERRLVVIGFTKTAMFTDNDGNVCANESGRCPYFITAFVGTKQEWRTDTTGWETYWDSCERGK